jgi:regulatory protein
LADGLGRSAYLDALTWLARRELSEAQIRQRLLRRQHTHDDIDAAVARLTAERAIDDSRVATAIARDAVVLKHRGRRRVLLALATAGIAPATAARAVEDVFGEFEPDALLSQALNRRLRGSSPDLDQKTRARLYRYLVGQGFEPGRVVAALRRRRLAGPNED